MSIPERVKNFLKQSKEVPYNKKLKLNSSPQSKAASPLSLTPRGSPVKMQSTNKELSSLLDAHSRTSHIPVIEGYLNVESKSIQNILKKLESEKERTINATHSEQIQQKTQNILKAVKEETLRMDRKISHLIEENQRMKSILANDKTPQFYIEKWAGTDNKIGRLCSDILKEQAKRLNTEEATSKVIVHEERVISLLEERIK